jgi:hypothetical protein
MPSNSDDAVVSAPGQLPAVDQPLEAHGDEATRVGAAWTHQASS